jgi:hypothetical protein
MSKKITFISFVLAFAFVSLLSAQESRLAGDIFAWFPEGVYNDLVFADMVKIAESPLYEMFKELMGNEGGLRYERDNPLPDSMKNAVESRTVASLLRLRTPQAEYQPADYDPVSGEDEETHESRKLLWVFRMADVGRER